ncbi:hypothetical protein D9M71_687090 [compost metagenome]
MPFPIDVGIFSRANTFRLGIKELVAMLQTGNDGCRLLSAIYGQEINAVTRIHQNDMEGITVINGRLHDLAVR